jgi:AAA domain
MLANSVIEQLAAPDVELLPSPTVIVPLASDAIEPHYYEQIQEIVNLTIQQFQARQAEEVETSSSTPAAAISLMEMIDTKYNEPRILLKGALQAGETVLLVGRQKEGKSTLSLQLAIDLATGNSFLGKFQTAKCRVLMVDYENRPIQVKHRGKMILNGRDTGGNLFVKSFPYLTKRDVGLSGKEHNAMLQLVQMHRPDVLLIDPLRYAAPKNGAAKEENWAVETIDAIDKLRTVNPQLTVIVVHHVRKTNADEKGPSLRDDPRTWIERTYGSQALIGHVDSIWGLEAEKDGDYTFATVPRSHGLIVLKLDKAPDSEVFMLSDDVLACLTNEQRVYWQQLPEAFNWIQAIQTVPKASLSRLIRTGTSNGILVKDGETYRKTLVARPN